MQVAIGFSFSSHWLINLREIFKPITERSNRNRVIDPYHSMSKQEILPVEPLIQCEAGRAKTMQRQSLYSPRTPKWPPSDKGELLSTVI